MTVGMSTLRFLVRFFAKLDIIDIRRRASHRISHLSETRLPSSFFFTSSTYASKVVNLRRDDLENGKSENDCWNAR
jgi:hypothetical protein